jgi:hypothetical protein
VSRVGRGVSHAIRTSRWAAATAFAVLIGASTGHVALGQEEAPAPGSRRVVVVLVDRATLALFSISSGVQNAAARGAAALMTTANGPGAGGSAPLAWMATLSAGEAAVAPGRQDGRRTVQPGAATEPAGAGDMGDLYRQRTGLAPGTADLLYPDVGLLARLNAEPTVGASPSLLGEVLRRHGVVAAAVGTSDLPGDPFRPAPVLAMDAAGRVEEGATDTDLAEPAADVPIAVDVEALQARTEEALTTSRFIVIDWGDVSRIDRLFVSEADRLSETDAEGLSLADRLDRARRQSMRTLDSFLTFVTDHLRVNRDVLVIVSPSPPVDVREGGPAVVPIVVSGPTVAHGSLTSDTTRIDGLISSADLAPTILRWFRLAIPDEMAGHPMRVEPAELPVQDATKHQTEFAEAAEQRTPVLSVALLVWLMALAVAVALVERRLRALERSLRGRSAPVRPRPAPQPRRVSARAARKTRQRRGTVRRREEEPMTGVRAVLFAAALVPLVLLLRAVTAPAGAVWGILALLVVTGGLGFVWAAIARRRIASALGAIGGGTVALLFLLGLSGSPAPAQSWAGVRYWEGRSFFGLGSLLAGAVVAGTILALGALARRTRRSPRLQLLVAASGGLVLVLLSLPSFGGTPVVGISGLGGVVAGALLLRDRAPSRRGWVAAAAGSAAVLVVAAGFVLAAQVARSRPADALVVSAPGEAAAAASILVRTASTAARLLFFSPWTVAILASLAVLAYTLLRPRGALDPSPRGRGLPPPDRHVQVTVVALAVATALAVLTSVRGAVTAAILLMAAAVLAVGGLLDRIRAPRTVRRG